MMRVLFCSQAAHTGGGVEAWMEALTDALTARGVEVYTGLAQGDFHDPERYAARHHVSHPLPVDGSLGYREVRIARLLRLFESVRPDVIIPVNLEDAFLAASYWKTRGGTAHLVSCIHGQGADRIDQVRRCAPFIDLATSVSRRVVNQLQRIIGESARVRHIPTGVPEPVAVPRARNHVTRLGYVGRLSQSEKRVFDAVELMKNLQGTAVTLRIAGSGPDENALREAARGLPVTFHGDLSRDVLYDSFYPSLDGIVVFSEAEAGPIVAWEAMSHGVVPFVSDYLGRAEEEVIRDGETGVVFPIGDMRVAAAAVRGLTAAGALSELSRRARADLPSAYRLPAFGQSWHEALAACTDMPLRIGTRSQLPSLVSTGRLAKLGLGVEVLARTRRLLGRRYPHADPGSEWPH